MIIYFLRNILAFFVISYVLLNNRLNAINLTNQVLSTVVNSDPAYYYNQCHQLHIKPVSSGQDWQLKRLYQLTYHLTLLTQGIEKSKLQEPAAPNKEELAIILLHLQGFNYIEISQITARSGFRQN